MSFETTREMHKAHALDLANLGIRSGVTADFAAARQAWQSAFDYAEAHLRGDDMRYWIRDGLGAALFQAGDYHGAIEMAGSALEWCASQRAPSASITMTRSLLRLGDVTRAREYLRQAVGLRGKAVLKVFDADDLAVLDPVASLDDGIHQDPPAV